MPGQYSGHSEDNSKSTADMLKSLPEIFNQQKSTLLEMIEQIRNYTRTILYLKEKH